MAKRGWAGRTLVPSLAYTGLINVVGDEPWAWFKELGADEAGLQDARAL